MREEEEESCNENLRAMRTTLSPSMCWAADWARSRFPILHRYRVVQRYDYCKFFHFIFLEWLDPPWLGSISLNAFIRSVLCLTGGARVGEGDWSLNRSIRSMYAETSNWITQICSWLHRQRRDRRCSIDRSWKRTIRKEKGRHQKSRSRATDWGCVMSGRWRHWRRTNRARDQYRWPCWEWTALRTDAKCRSSAETNSRMWRSDSVARRDAVVSAACRLV